MSNAEAISASAPARLPSPWAGVLWAWQLPRAGGGISRARLVWRAFVAAAGHRSAMRRWMAVAFDHEARGLLTDARGEYLRAVRPYVHRHTSYTTRVVQLIDHADWMENAFQPPILDTLGRGESIVLMDLQPPRGWELLRLQLQRSPVQSPEGELLLTMVARRSPEVQPKPVAVQVAALAFSRFRLEGAACLAVGGVRGPRHPTQRMSAIELGQALVGWKPSVLMVRVAQELARCWNLRLIGLDPSSHRLLGWSYQWSRRHREAAQRIYGSYDALWEHFEAPKGPPGWMVLPAESDEKLAATALSPERRARQTARADFWIRTRRDLRKRFREILLRPGRDPNPHRITQSLQESTVQDVWELEDDDDSPSTRPPGPAHSVVLVTGPGTLM